MLCSRANLKRWNEGEVNQDLPFDRLAQSAHFVFVILVRKARTRGLSSKFPLLREGAPEANLGRHNSRITAMSVGMSSLLCTNSCGSCATRRLDTSQTYEWELGT